MRGILAAMRQNMKKTARVADENMVGDGNGDIFAPNVHRARQGWNGLSFICSIVRAPLSLLSCLTHPHINGADGVWVSGELARISEMNHLMVSDSMRYAILISMKLLGLIRLAKYQAITGQQKRKEPTPENALITKCEA
ncbi:hypothetical protein RJ640_013621 [Escallonia rubra]|uniref:Uncharacterized protein n=1 Tax=Escallonia rubra TaxID=112253 RepID=A0AA88R0Y7_9ASTE|nr:hypothetical protein RJ640_013621 [Escallonia rubra]